MTNQHTDEMQWQPIENAPKGEWMVVTKCGMSRGWYAIAAQIDGIWLRSNAEKNVPLGHIPTHFMPLPTPPEAV